MKIILNSAVPGKHRPLVEGLVNRLAPGSQITWRQSRFPRLVMLVEPDAEPITAGPTGGSIFDAPDEGSSSLVSFASDLEDSIQRTLAGVSS